MKLLGAAIHAGLAKRIVGDFQTATKKHDAVKKDIHLIQGALMVDRIVASLERNLRDYLREVKENFAELKSLTWINPYLESAVGDWLEQGAPADPQRVL